MTGERKRIKVTIDGKSYTIVGNKSNAHVNLVAETVNQQLTEIKSLSNTLLKEEQAMLIAVNAVSEQIEIHKKMIQLEEELSSLKEKIR